MGGVDCFQIQAALLHLTTEALALDVVRVAAWLS